jgi:hypothetical protein
MDRATLLAVLGLVVGVLGVAAAFGAAWWFGRGPRVVMQVSGTTLISAPENPHIKVLYDRNEVRRVTQSVIWLWREGRGTVKGSDIDSDDPVMINVPNEERILDVAVLVQSKETNKVEVIPDPADETRATIRFKYLEPRQGAAIEVLHTGEGPKVVTVSGTIMGVPKGITAVESQMSVDIYLAGAGIATVTMPRHSVPRNLRIADRSHRQRFIATGGARAFAESAIRLIVQSFLP